jgi:hypothetical protein
MRRSRNGSRGATGPRIVRFAIAAALVGGPSPASAFRTSSDLQDFRGQERVAFDGTIDLQLYEAVPTEVDVADVEVAALAAVNAWNSPECSSLVMSFNGTTSLPAVPGDGRNTIEWVADWASRGLAAESAGITDVQYERTGDAIWRIVEADVYLNGSLAWSTRLDSSGRDVLTVLTHEFGHVAGLLHPCEEETRDGAPSCADTPEARESTMYPLYSLTQSSLGEDDVAGVCFLYPQKACTPSSCELGELCGDDGACHEECGSDWCRSGSTCVEGICRDVESAPNVDECSGQNCTQERGAFGAPCMSASDCDDDRCLAVEGRDPSCTRTCREGEASCPLGWSCATVEYERVCAPAFLEPAGGCSVSWQKRHPTVASAALGAPWLICGVILLVIRRTRASARRKP